MRHKVEFAWKNETIPLTNPEKSGIINYYEQTV